MPERGFPAAADDRVALAAVAAAAAPISQPRDGS